MRGDRAERLLEAERVAGRVAASLGLEVVEFAFHSRGRHSQLRIDIDRPGMPGAGLADCEAVARALDEPLEALDFFDAPYELQVSTPGLDRNIRSADDLRRNAGRPVRVEYRDEGNVVREARGTLSQDASGGRIRVATEAGEIAVDADRISLMKQEVMPPRGKRVKR